MVEDRAPAVVRQDLVYLALGEVAAEHGGAGETGRRRVGY
jgi:hypothetical protein